MRELEKVLYRLYVNMLSHLQCSSKNWKLFISNFPTCSSRPGYYSSLQPSNADNKYYKHLLFSSQNRLWSEKNETSIRESPFLLTFPSPTVGVK